MAYNASQKLMDNIAALQVALAHKPGAICSDTELVSLRKFSGFGGIKAVLYGDGSQDSWLSQGATAEDMRLYEKMQQLYDLLRAHFTGEDEYRSVLSSIKNSTLTAFYTPDFVAGVLSQSLTERGMRPVRLYEPSAGSGVFIREAVKSFPGLQQVVAVEKDILTGKVIQAINDSLPVNTVTHVMGFEDAPTDDNGIYDLVVSNIPFGNFRAFDREITDDSLKGRIHNYFFAKGLDKLKEGGVMAYITTDAFLNSPSNRFVREYLFERTDFVSLAVMPDNLMTETGNTQAPNHLLIVQKHTDKTGLSSDEQLLVSCSEQRNDYGAYHLNDYISLHPEIICANQISAGRNQYGEAHQRIWQEGDIEGIAPGLSSILQAGLQENLDLELFNRVLSIDVDDVPEMELPALTYTAMPEINTVDPDHSAVQLGIFDTAPLAQSNRALDYISDKDATIVKRESAKVLSIVRASDHPDHELVVLITAKHVQSNYYLYKIYCNTPDTHAPGGWLNAKTLPPAIQSLCAQLRQYRHSYSYEGDQSLKSVFDLQRVDPMLYEGLRDFYKEGTLVIHRGMAGIINKLDFERGRASFQPVGQDIDTAFYERYVQMRDAYLELFREESEGKTDVVQLRQQLNDHYAAFTDQYGFLNAPANSRKILTDTAYGLATLSSLERRQGVTFVKADILLGSLHHQEELFTTEDPVEALANCLNIKGKVDLDYISEMVNQDRGQVISGLEKRIFLNPATGAWETADQYLSGNVVAKLRIAEQKAAEESANGHFAKSLEALRSVQPERIPFEVLDFNLGERWIPREYYERFSEHIFDTRTAITYLASLDSFKVQRVQSAKIGQEFAIVPRSGRTMYGYTLLEHALENTTPFFTYEVQGPDGKPIRLCDNEATQLAFQKVEKIRASFIQWLSELPDEDKRNLEALYNDTFNCYRLREYDGSHLTFPGLNLDNLEIDDLYSSQRNAAWRLVQNRGGLIDHEVGLGKTLTMIVASREMKRLGIVQKPAILALKANVSQIADTYRQAYPYARILTPSENDFTPANRMRLFHEIGNNHWDCIIITHDQFLKIPQSPQIQQQIFQAELVFVEMDLLAVKDFSDGISKKMLKGLEVRKTNLIAKLKELESRLKEKRDDGIDFKSMGIDHLFVDESHKFKNLAFTTRHNRVAGLGNTAGSMKAMNMLFAIRTLQEKFDSDLCATFLSGTPISNSLTELYLIFKYLRPREMERQCIQNFDAWAAVFARKTTDFEFSVTNEIIAKERFRHFIKVPELAIFYNEITDYKTASHIQLDKPELVETLVNLSPTPEQAEFAGKLMEFARTGDARSIDRPPLTSKEETGKMLIATNYAKKMSVDMRLISEDRYSDHPDNKINECSRRVAEIYKESASYKGTQLVFCDMGTPGTAGFNIYEALKEKLVRDLGIPAVEIAFIHDWQGKKKQELFTKVNNGDIRILCGSTEMLGTGTNVQERVVGMHDLDIPWKPSELEQRSGRGARQGNWVAKLHCDNKVRKFIYATEQSLDNYKFNLLKNKQLFISQMKNNELHIRSIDEGALDEQGGMNFAEYVAILSGDTSLLEKTKLEKKLSVVEGLKSAYNKEMARTRLKLEQGNAELENKQQILERLKKDEALYQSVLVLERDGAKSNPVSLHGNTDTDPEIVGGKIIRLYQQWKPGSGSTEQEIGTLYGFKLVIQHHEAVDGFDSRGDIKFKRYNSLLAVSPQTGIKYTYNNGAPNVDNPKLAARYFLSAIDRVISIREQHERRIAVLGEEIGYLSGLMTKPFEKEQELKEMKSELRQLEQRISTQIQKYMLAAGESPVEGTDELVCVPDGPGEYDLIVERSEDNMPGPHIEQVGQYVDNERAFLLKAPNYRGDTNDQRQNRNRKMGM